MSALADAVRSRLADASQLYHQLLLVVGGQGSGKTAALRELSESGPFPLVNVNLALSQRLLEFTSKARPLRLPRLLDEIVAGIGGSVVLLDNIEILFDPTLRQDPLRCLQGISRNRTIVATWNGTARGRTLTCAEPRHREYRRYTDVDAMLVSTSCNSDAGADEGDAR